MLLCPINAASNGGDLAKARASIESADANSFVPKGDGTLQLVRAHGPLQAADDIAAWLAAQPSWQGTLILGGDEILDGALRHHGLPSIGTGGDRTALQALLPLSVAAGWRAADPAELHELLTIRPSPIPRALAFRLMNALQKWPALDSDNWRKALDEELKSIEGGFREKVAERISTIFGFAANRGDLYPADAIRERMHCLLSWVGTRTEDLDGALGAVRVQCETLLETLKSSEQESFSPSELKRWLHMAQASAPRAVVQRSQAGLTSLRRPAAMVGPAARTIWWNFDLANAPHPKRLRLCAAERAELAAGGVELPDSGIEAQAIAARWRRPLLLTREQLILVCPMTDQTGAAVHPHPLWDEVSAAAKNRDPKAMVHARPKGTHLAPEMDLTLRPLVTPVLEWTSPGKLPMREQESPSGLGKLLSCPLQWALEYHVRLGEGVADPPPAPDPLLYGNLAHKILERVLSEWPLTPAQAKARATILFDEEAPRLAEALFLPRYGAQRADVRHRIIRAAEAVARVLEKNDAAVEAVETSYERDVGDMKFRGRIDLLTQTPSLVIDWKWGSSSYVGHLRKGTALQLAAYAYLTTNGHGRPKAGYFSVSSGELHMESGAELEHANTQGSYTMDDTWDAVLVALKARRDELGECLVHAPGAATPLAKKLEDKRTKEGDLMLVPKCGYCSFRSLCGKDFVT